MEHKKLSPISLFPLFLGIFIVPLLVLLLAGYLVTLTGPSLTAPDFIVDLDYAPATQPGIADKVVGQAPAHMELGIYLNGELAGITNSNLGGSFFSPLPVLPNRRNSLAALPTKIDSSTLLLLYTPTGIDTGVIVIDTSNEARIAMM